MAAATHVFRSGNFNFFRMRGIPLLIPLIYNLLSIWICGSGHKRMRLVGESSFVLGVDRPDCGDLGGLYKLSSRMSLVVTADGLKGPRRHVMSAIIPNY
jgi:hypothetical protein